MDLEKSLVSTKDVVGFAKNEVFKRIDDRFKIPKEIMDWGVNEMARCYTKAKTKKSKLMIVKKITHTQEVLMAGVDICLKTPEINWNFTQIATICFLHDIGRFKQALYQTFSDSLSIDHARVGADMFKAHKWSCLEENGLDPDVVYEAIDRHSRRIYEGENNYVKLIRDADKLGLLRQAPEVLVEKSLPNGPASEEVVHDFNSKTLVDYKKVKTQADSYLMVLAWPKDFSFKATHELYKKSVAPEWLKKQALTQDPKLEKLLSNLV